MLKRILILSLVMITLLALLTSCGSDTVTTTTATTRTPTTTTPITTTTTTVTTQQTTATPATTTPVTTTPDNKMAVDSQVAFKMVDFLYNLEAIQNYYNDGVLAMATFQVEMSRNTRNTRDGSSIPQEFKDKLPAGGAMQAPAGACPAAAQPEVTFVTESGEAVSPEMITEKALESVSEEYVSVTQEESTSLLSYIEALVNENDPRLITPEGWNELLWDKLSDLHEPVESLWDYQLWNIGSEIETQIADLYYQGLVDAGVPQIVLDAYEQSNTQGWYSNQQATPEDALGRMEIEAEMTGSISGMVTEHRNFSITDPGESPEYGPQTGEGIVTSNLPEAGNVEFSVDINLTEFDKQGRAIGGTVVAEAIDYEDYQVVFTFNPDGSKDGVVIKGGEEVGYLTMTVDHDKFENYIDVSTGTEMQIPENILPKY